MVINFGKKIKYLRESKGILQTELAKMIGVTNAMISACENDIRQPSIETLAKIAIYFNVSMDYLFGKTERNTMGISIDVSNISKQHREVVNEMVEAFKAIDKSGNRS
jgi:transcriptional regulator with XRE-family HTH domain